MLNFRTESIGLTENLIGLIWFSIVMSVFSLCHSLIDKNNKFVMFSVQMAEYPVYQKPEELNMTFRFKWGGEDILSH